MSRRVDAHAHLVPDDYRRELDRRGLSPYPLPPWSQELMDTFMARYAIDATVVSLSPPGVFFGDQGLANELARMANERTAELVRSDPRRFAGLAFLPLPDVEAAISEARFALDELGLDGVVLLSNVDGIYPGATEWAPLFDELDRRGTYVFLHPTAPATPAPMPDHPVWLYEFPFDTTRAIANLIYSGTLERCPELRLQVAHLGGTATFLGHRLAELAGREPERRDAAPAGALTYLSRLFYDTGLSNNAPAVAAAREIAPLEQIVFGLDWPYAALPELGDPAPGLSGLRPQERAALESRHIAALVPRLGVY